jgi:sarcosine/dimethylglycine N-methyltransferase
MSTTIDFYTGHPISTGIIEARLRAAHGGLEGLNPEDLFAHDQDHYGGLAVNDALAVRAQLKPGLEIVDFCAGLGGPARYFARRYGVRVTGVELTPARVAGAERLTALVGLGEQVRVIEGDVTACPLPDASADVVLSQEAFLHIPHKPDVLAEAFRLLRPGGRLAFTDWIAHSPPEPEDMALLKEGIAVAGLWSIPDYEAGLEAAGFEVEHVDDLTGDWAVFLRERLAMFNRMRAEAEAAGTPPGQDAFYRAYVRFVALVGEAVLGGARFAARKPR